MALFYIKAMTKYRFKTKEEFIADGEWNTYPTPHPKRWNEDGKMNHQLGQDIQDQFISKIENGLGFSVDGDWSYYPSNVILNEEVKIEQVLEQIKLNNQNSLINKQTMKKASTKPANAVAEKFVFMDKTVNILNVGFSTCKNVVLYGPGE